MPSVAYLSVSASIVFTAPTFSAPPATCYIHPLETAKERAMVHNPKRNRTLVLRLIVGLALLGWPRVGATQGTWSVIATTGSSPGQVSGPVSVAVDGTGNLYVADNHYAGEDSWIYKRDAQENWSVVAAGGGSLGRINSLSAL